MPWIKAQKRIINIDAAAIWRKLAYICPREFISILRRVGLESCQSANFQGSRPVCRLRRYD